MQCVGQPCTICEARIAMANEAHGCDVCQVVWHIACVPSANTCPRCGANVVEKAQERQDNETAKLENLHRIAAQGRSIYMAVMLSYLLIVFASAFFAWRTIASSPMAMVGILLRLLAFTWIWSCAYSGSSVARKSLGVLALLGLFLSFIFISINPTLFIIYFVAIAFTVWACWFSPQIKVLESVSKRP